MNSTALSLTSIGGYVGYGLTEKLDLFVTLGTANVGGLATGLSSSLTAYGATLKYALLSEGANAPVSVAIGGGYKVLSTKMKTPAGSATADGSQIGATVGISKLIVPFIPYGGLTYRSTSSGGSQTATQIDATIGSAIAWSLQGAVFVEYTLQSVQDKTGLIGDYSSGQIGAGVGYTL